MVRKDEPLKVTDLETGDDATSSTSAKETAKPNSVFNRLAYGGGSKKSGKKEQTTEVTTKTETGKTGKSVTGKTSGKSPAIKSAGQPNKSSASSSNEAQQLAAAGGGSVFDRLTSGDRLYRTTQTGRKPAGRRADATVDYSGSTSSSKVNKSKLLFPTGSSEAGGAGPAISGSDETANNVIIGSPERQETDEFNEEDPAINISLIQPPAKVRSPRPVLKKSARLLLSQREQLHRRKSWRLQRIPVALVERTSLARGALPVLPQGLAWICLILNGLLPGTGTILSGLLGMCLGAPRFSARVTTEHRLLAFIINLTIGIFQAFTVLFCLVGWCWALGWGIILVKTSGHYNRWKVNNLDSCNEDGLPPVLVTNNPDPRY